MATTTTATVRRKMCRELLDLRVKNDKLFKKMDSLKASLVAEATKLGENFKEFFDKRGRVSVSPPKDKECKGTVAVVDQVKFFELTEAQQKKHLDSGLITLVQEWTREYSGRCDVRVFET